MCFDPFPERRVRGPPLLGVEPGTAQRRVPELVRKIADLTIFNQSKGKSGSYAHAAHVGIEDPTISNQSKGKSGSYAHAARVGM
jgi:D-Tyr-tRNAtyr deacylase